MIAGHTQTTRAVLFDLGGVLLPFDRERRVAAISARTGASPDAVRAFMALDLHHRLDTGEASEFDLAEEFSAFFGVRVSPVEASDLVASVFEAPNEALWELAGLLRSRVVVGGFSDNPNLVLQAFPPGGFLDPLFLSGEIRACKPSAEAFAAVEAGLRMAPRQILFIDDTPANVAAALERGWDAILFTSNAALIADLAARGLP
jgi:FMN phosphatase YigB (HAD superfamily)